MSAYKFFQKSTQEWIDAPEEVWQWEAYYDDGTILKQFGDDWLFHQFAEIDQSRLAVFKMTSKQFPQVYSIAFSDPKNMKLIHFYRNTVLNAGTNQEERYRIYCFGYEKKINTKTEKFMLVITHTGNLIATEDPDLVVVDSH